MGPMVSRVRPKGGSARPSVFSVRPSGNFTNVFMFFRPGSFPCVMFCSLSLRDGVGCQASAVGERVVLAGGENGPMVKVTSSVL